jgi:predicted PurR-regulated permease PerM
MEASAPSSSSTNAPATGNTNPVAPVADTLVPPAAATQPEYHPQWGRWTRQMVTIGLVLALIVAMIVLAPVSQTIIATALLTFLLYVPARLLAKYSFLNFTGGVLVTYLILLIILGVLVGALIPQVSNAVDDIGTGITEGTSRAREMLYSYTAENSTINIFGSDIDVFPIIQTVRDTLFGVDAEAVATTTQSDNTITNSIGDNIGNILRTATGTVGSVLGSVTGFFSTSFLAIFLSFLILLDLPRYQDGVIASISPAYRREMFLLLEKISRVWTGFFRGQLLLAVIIGVLTYVQLMLMGVSSAVPLAFLIALISLIPTIGGILSLVPLFIVPAVGGSSVFTDLDNIPFALLVVVVNLVWTQIIWNVVAPKIMGDAVALPLPAIIIGIIIGSTIGGALGAFLIVPVLGSLRLIILYCGRKISQRDPFPGEAARMPEDLSKL